MSICEAVRLTSSTNGQYSWSAVEKTFGPNPARLVLVVGDVPLPGLAHTAQKLLTKVGGNRGEGGIRSKDWVHARGRINRLW